MRTKRIFIALVAVVMVLTCVLAACKPSTSAPATFNITKGTASNGTFLLKMDGNVVSSAKAGDKITVVPTADEGYEVEKVYFTTSANSTETEVSLTDGQYTFTMPESDVTVYVLFKLSEQPSAEYKVTKASTSDGTFTVSVDGKETETAEAGATVTVVPSANEGYEVERIYFTTAAGTSETEVVESDGVYSFTMPESDVTVYVVFKSSETPIPSYTLSKESGSAVTLFVDGVQAEVPTEVKQSAQVTVQFDREQYVVGEIYYITEGGKTVISPVDGVYTFTMPSSDVTVGGELLNTSSVSDFKFEYLEESNSYAVTEYSGENSNVVIPRTYEGLPVTQIGSYAMLSTSVKSVVIHSDITVIDMYALSSCVELTTVRFEEGSKLEIIGDAAFMSSGLTSIEIPASVKQIGIQTFDSCIDLASVVFEKGSQLQSVGGNAFGSTAITSISIPASVTSFDCAFNDCRQLVTVVFEGNNITEITDYTFMNCLKLQSIVLPASVNSIGSKAFFMCNSPLVVYYGGNQAQWEQLESKPQSTPYFYSETKPQESGNYWHFAENGAPIVWEI